MSRPLLTLLLLVTLAALTTGVLLNLPSNVLPTAARDDDPQPQLEAYMNGVNTRQYNPEGELEYRFEAPQMAYYQPRENGESPGEYATIEQPYFVIRRGEAAPWYLRAKRGRSTRDGDLVVLREAVRIWQNAPGEPETRITTSQLSVWPNRKVAETDRSVTIEYPRITTRGRGMHADLQRETFSILAEGTTHYEP